MGCGGSKPADTGSSGTALVAQPNTGFNFQGGTTTGGVEMMKSKNGYYQGKGKKRAVFIGINYIGSPAQLSGCWNDVKNIHAWLTANYDFTDDNILVLTDESTDPNKKPTRVNILSALAWLVNGAATGDSLFLHYSGHGGTTQDTSGDEIAGKDSTIVPVDYTTNGQILDDDLFNILVKPLPVGCHLTCLFDSCHSESVLDLPWIYTADGGLDPLGAAQKKVNLTEEQKQKYETMRSSSGTVVQFAGSQDDQTSADAIIGGLRTGAASYAFIQVLTQNKTPTYTQMLKGMRDCLAASFSQVMQMSTSQRMIMEQPFTL